MEYRYLFEWGSTNATLTLGWCQRAHVYTAICVCGLSLGFCNSLSIKCLFPPLWHVNKKRILYSNHAENSGSSTIETSHARQGRQIFQRNAIADKLSACEGMYFLGLYCKIKNAKCDKWKQCQIHCRRRYSFFTVMLKCHNYISLHCFLRICMSAVTIIAAMNQTFISLLRASILLNFVWTV